MSTGNATEETVPNPDLGIVVASETKQSRLPREDCHASVPKRRTSVCRHACVPKRLNGGTLDEHFGVQARTLRGHAMTCQQKCFLF